MTGPAISDETIPANPAAQLGAVSGALLVIANIIGVGVFTTTGFMVGAVPSPPAILLAWLLGGVAALCGTLTYAELGAAIPRNGGEYRLLSRIYHPAVGFTAGWVSLIVGFSAPLALFAKAFGTYLQQVVSMHSPVDPRQGEVPPWLSPEMTAGLILIFACAVLHAVHVKTGSRLHNAFTVCKIGLILLFCAAGALRGDSARLANEPGQPFAESCLSASFAVQLVYVSFSYTGWNAALYLAGEFRHPQRDIPRALFSGVGIVTALYFGMNVVFFISAPLAELSGQEAVAHVAAEHLFGPQGGRFVSLLIVAGLVSTVSANLLAGSRVYEAIGADFTLLRFLTVRPADGGPVAAIALQAVVAVMMLVTATFDGLLKYVGVTLSLSAVVTVLGAIVLRWREPDLPRPYRTWGYPITPAIFVALEGWMIFFSVRKDPLTGACGAATVASGLLLYGLLQFAKSKSEVAKPQASGESQDDQ
jgi:APA family basic amino acid/polyamine antiporter